MNATTLRHLYETASGGTDPENGEYYDKLIELNTGEIYEGGLLIGRIFSPLNNSLYGNPGQDVRIIGNGAVLDLQGSQLSISYTNNKLVIDDCIVLNGNIRFRGATLEENDYIPTGKVSYCTFYKPHDYGIRLQGAGTGVELTRNIVVDALDTGDDYIFSTGYSTDFLPTGGNYSLSVQVGMFGTPVVQNNWSYQSNSHDNQEPLNHFNLLCEWG